MIIKLVPRFLQRYTTPMKDAPFSHIVSFLVLHEVTAIVPLVILATTFHYTGWLPPFISDWKWVSDGTQKFGDYFRRKGWIGRTDDPDPVAAVEGKRTIWWNRSESGVRVVFEYATFVYTVSSSGLERGGIFVECADMPMKPRVATAWAITKTLMPLRLVLSVWATPWFARTGVIRLGNFFRRTMGEGRAGTAPPTQSTMRHHTGKTEMTNRRTASEITPRKTPP